MSIRSELAKLKKAVGPRRLRADERRYYALCDRWTLAFVQGELLPYPLPPTYGVNSVEHHDAMLRIGACCEARWRGVIDLDKFLPNMTEADRIQTDRICRLWQEFAAECDSEEEDLTLLSDEELTERLTQARRGFATDDAEQAASLELFRRRYSSAHPEESGDDSVTDHIDKLTERLTNHNGHRE